VIVRLQRRRAAAAAAGFVAAAVMAQAAQAQPSITTESAVFVERTKGGSIRRLEPASRLTRGDRVVTVLTWYRLGGSGDFVITNPLPRTVAYQASARDDQEVSADGGRSWGRLGELRRGERLATPEDVTHIRWRIAARHADTARGQIVYSGIVR